MGIDLDKRGKVVGKKRLILVFLWMWVFAFPLSAASFALRGLEKGAKMSDIELAGITVDGGKLSSFTGEKGLVVIYWSTWSSRSPAILEFAEKDLRRYEEKGVKVLAINADHQEMRSEDIAAVKAKAVELGLSFPVVLDAGLKGYNELGIISTPTTLILARDLTIIDAYPGFPSVARDDIPDRLDAFLGIPGRKRAEKAQYLLDHKPKNHALQYYNLGKTMFGFARSPSGELRGVPGNAIERLDEAIRRDPDFFRPYLLKAIIFDLAKDGAARDAALAELAKRDFQEVYERRVLGFGYLYLGMDNVASDYFRMLSSQIPDDPGVLFGQAVVSAKTRDAAAARQALEGLRKNPGAAEALGFDYGVLFEATGERKAGTEGDLRTALETLLEIRKSGSGSLRKDAPVQPGASPPPATREAPGEPPAGTR